MTWPGVFSATAAGLPTTLATSASDLFCTRWVKSSRLTISEQPARTKEAAAATAATLRTNFESTNDNASSYVVHHTNMRGSHAARILHVAVHHARDGPHCDGRRPSPPVTRERISPRGPAATRR